jgi:hypothetical protein
MVIQKGSRKVETRETKKERQMDGRMAQNLA